MRIGLLLLLALAGCSAPPAQFTGPNGNRAYSMNCGSTVGHCYKLASALCPQGYTILGTQTGMVAAPTAYGTMASPRHSMAVECSD